MAVADTPAEQGRAAGAPRGRVRSFLVADRAPMWFTLFALLFGAGGTYFVAPQVNAQFEVQKIKTDFVIRNYADLRTKMEDFQGLYAVVSQKLAAGEDVRADVSRLQELVGRVNAQNLSMLPMFTKEGGPKAAAGVTVAMNGMINVLFAHAGQTIETPEQVAAYSGEILKASQALAVPLLELYVRIGEVGRLEPTEKDVELEK